MLKSRLFSFIASIGHSKSNFNFIHCSRTLLLEDVLKEKIENFVKSAPVTVFMKGTQTEPLCGFSRNVKLILDLHRIPFKDFNVLEDEKIREGIKEFSDWPTIPQVYVNGKFVGGADIFMQMHKDGENMSTITDITRSNKIGISRNVDYVGFANFPNQVFRRCIKNGFEFTLMVVG
uniref:Glutaredoxin-related protein 5, mitochondrial n=1 Tax=Meloidogyne hapla TaxID=6305 RepID=A0A1I8B5V0_MELHA